jgi:hypothetical protein
MITRSAANLRAKMPAPKLKAVATDRIRFFHLLRLQEDPGPRELIDVGPHSPRSIERQLLPRQVVDAGEPMVACRLGGRTAA